MELFLCFLESKNTTLLTKAYNAEKCKGELRISPLNTKLPSPFQMCIVCICTSSSRKLVRYILATQMKLPSNRKLYVCFKQTSRQTCITHKVMFSSIPKEISSISRFFFSFLNKCVLSCIQINLVSSSSLLAHCSHASLSCSQRVRRNSCICMSYASQKKEYMQSSGDCHFHNQSLWWHLVADLCEVLRGCLTAQIPSKSAHSLLLHIFLSSNTLL